MPLDDRLVVLVPEGGQLEVPLAGVATRAVAAAIDAVLAMAVILALAGSVWGSDGVDVDSMSGWWLGSIPVVGALLVVVAWPLAWEVLSGGRTPGKRVMGLRVLRADGSELDRRALVIRNVLRVVDALPPPYGAGLAVAAATAHTQRIGDLAAGTVVVRDVEVDLAALWGARGAAPPVFAPPPPPPMGGPLSGPPLAARPTSSLAPPVMSTVPPIDPSIWDTGGLNDVDRLVVRRFLERRGTLPVGTRHWLGTELTRRLLPKVVGAPATVAPEQFLEGVVHAARR